MSYRPFDRSPAQDAELDRLEAAAKAAGASGVAVLDVDGCLFDTRWRQVHILRAWAEETGRYGVARVEVEHFVDRDLRHTLLNAGLPSADVEAWAPELRDFWGDRFFDDEHVDLDVAMPGAVRFVRRLHASGLHVVYLTGRHTSMRPATIRSFRRYGFPLDDRATILDKREPRMEDHVHKSAMLDAVDRLGRVVLAMDNEPINANLFADRWAGARVVFVETDASERPIVPYAHLPVILGFLRTSDP